MKVGDDNGGRVPVNAQTVLLNVTGVDAASDGFVTVWPCGTDRTLASTINLMHGQTVANLTVSRLGPGGRVCVYTQSSANLVVDVFGYFGGAPTAWTSPPPLNERRSSTGSTSSHVRCLRRLCRCSCSLIREVRS